MLYPLRRPLYPIQGVTLIELLIVIALVGLLSSMAIPSYRHLVANSKARMLADMLAYSMRLARTEAIKRYNTVTVCAPNAGRSNCAFSAASWDNGWLLVVNAQNPSVATTLVIQDFQPTIPSGTTSLSTANYAVTYDWSGLRSSGVFGINFTPPHCINGWNVAGASTSGATLLSGISCP